MTDKLPPLSTQIVAPSQTAFPTPSAVPAQQGATKQEVVEEEPYTIKCICNYSDDDGNTIYCETCDTWQHIECFYPDNVEDALREDFAHSCAECKPRNLDRQKAHERQTSRLTMPAVEEETTDKKPKRPPTKSHKKKPKPTDLQLNGHSSNPENSKLPGSHDHPPSKKSKHSHKASHSISSQAPKRSPSLNTNGRVNQGHPPSPATTPPDLPSDFKIHNYSPGFLSLYDEQGVQIVQTNSFVRLEISNTMSVWLRDPERMRRETGLEYNDVFQKLPKNINSLKRNLHIEHKKVPFTPPGTVLHWQYLTAPSAIEKDVPLMELNGQIGFQKDYCSDAANRWDELTSPLPFVFFHPMLPLYIDTRKEGSRARYVRRSCKPNAVLDAYLSEGSEYHFWLVSDRPIAAKEQITIPWDFRFPMKNKPRMLRLLGLGDEETGTQGEPEIDDLEYQTMASWVHLVLSEFGGCACDLGRDCAFARFHRNYFSGAQTRSNAPKKKSRKPKTQHAISPTSTGHATNSRAASEGHLDDVTEIDDRSQSGSSRSKPPSRDMTPARQGSFDTLGILTEPTDRDKRKVAMVEDSFRRMEQQQPPRKKKRVSDGSGTSKAKSTSRGSSSSHGPNQPNGVAERRYVDAGTSRSKSTSPLSVASPLVPTIHKAASPGHGSVPPRSRQPSVTPRPNYCDAAVQTDPIEGEWYSGIHPAPKPKRRIVSLSKRLLDNRHRLRLDDEEKLKEKVPVVQECPATAKGIYSPTVEEKPSFESPSFGKDAAGPVDSTTPSLGGSYDTPMLDAPLRPPKEMKPPPALAASLAKLKSPDLRVQMPSGPAFGSPTSAISTASTPASAGSTMMQTPFSANNLPIPLGTAVTNGTAVNPSPVKKKMSLSDYRSRMNKVQAARPSVGTTMLKPPSANDDEPKSATSLDTPGARDSPTAEKAVIDTGASTNGVPAPALTGSNV